MQRNSKIGGGNTYLLALMPALRKRGHRVVLMTREGPWLEACRQACDALYMLPTLPFLVPGAIRQVVHRESIEVADAQTPRYGQATLRACADSRTPVIVHVHRQHHENLANYWLDRAAAVMVHNQINLEWVLAECPDLAGQVVLTPLALDTHAFVPTPLPDAGMTVVHSARMSKRKGRFMLPLTEAAGLLLDEFPSLRLRLLGAAGRRSHPAQAAAIALNQATGRQVVELLPLTTNPRPIYKSASVILGAGYVALEGLALGRWVIGIGFQGLYGLVTEEDFADAVDCNFGDSAAPLCAHPGRKDLATEMRRALRLVSDGEMPSWAPPAIQAGFSAEVVAEHVEQILTDAIKHAN